MNIANVLAISVVSLGLTSAGVAGVSDFYVADGAGTIYTVDGQTLAATEVFSIDGGLAINDIIFTGNNKMLANVTDKLIEYDMSTGEERVVFDVQDYYDDDGFYFTSGFAGASNGDLFFSVFAITEDRTEQFGATFDPFTGTYTESAVLETVPGLYFDHLQIGENMYLGADFQGDQIQVFNSLTGDTIASYEAGFGPVSFLELDGQIFTMSDTGELYTFDLLTGDSEFFGEITGVTASLLGAANTNVFRIPTPGTLSLLGLSSLIVTRRRR